MKTDKEKINKNCFNNESQNNIKNLKSIKKTLKLFNK